MQLGFMPGKETTDVIFIMRQVQEKHWTMLLWIWKMYLIKSPEGGGFEEVGVWMTGSSIQLWHCIQRLAL